MNYKVLITTSGLGSRLGELTKYTNKALVRIGKKPAISYVIETYPLNTNFVITLGYKGNQVKDFLELAYPDRKFAFVWVDKYEGPGASLGYSMLQARDKLQEPFIYHACDTIVERFSIPDIKNNWAAGLLVNNFDHYTSFTSFDGEISSFNKKKVGKIGDHAHVGLVGIYNYREYWDILDQLYCEDPNNSDLNDVSVLLEMLKNSMRVRSISLDHWLDIGNSSSLVNARLRISDKFDNLDKVDESLFFFDKFVIKFFSDPEKIKKRVERGNILGKLVPKTLEVKENFYKYGYVEGEKYSEVVTPQDLDQFMVWVKKNLWKSEKEVEASEFKKRCRDFYERKTKERVEMFLAKRNIKDVENVINGKKVPTLKDLFSQIDFEWLSDGLQTGFHGDFILENILKTKNGYTLLDWRQDFNGLLRAGDMYYDLAKFYHNLTVNHDTISKNNFTINVSNENIICSIERKTNLLESEKKFEEIIQKNKFDMKKVKILRAIIWLNMSPLHHQPFDIFLFYFGKYYLWKTLKE